MRTKTSVGLCLGFVALVAWALPACGDDDDNGGTATGGAAGAGGGSGGGTSGSSGAAGAAGSEFVCKTPGTSASTGNCTTQADALKKCYEDDGTVVDCPDGGGTVKDLGDITGDCARSSACLGVTDPVENATCVNTCIQDLIKGAVTPACTQCYAEAAACSKVNCITHCIVSGNPKCEPCQCACNCIQANAECTGIPSTTCG